MIPFVREFDFAYGRRDQVSLLIQRVIAANPGPFTFTGTGTYIVGRSAPGSALAVIDPGPADPDHLAKLVEATAGRSVTHVLVTHTHRDHAPLARPFADAVGAPIYAAAPPARSVHASTPDEEDDEAFRPDVTLKGGERLTGDGWTIEAIATPGHASNHMAFALEEENALFSGDHVMGWSTTVVAPPDGDMSAYMTSLATVMERKFSTIWPTHGPPVRDVGPFLTAYRNHRLSREARVLDRLAAGDRKIGDMVPVLYADIDPRLWPAAGLSVWAHLIALSAAGRVRATPDAGSMAADWTLL